MLCRPVKLCDAAMRKRLRACNSLEKSTHSPASVAADNLPVMAGMVLQRRGNSWGCWDVPGSPAAAVSAACSCATICSGAVGGWYTCGGWMGAGGCWVGTAVCGKARAWEMACCAAAWALCAR